MLDMRQDGVDLVGGEGREHRLADRGAIDLTRAERLDLVVNLQNGVLIVDPRGCNVLQTVTENVSEDGGADGPVSSEDRLDNVVGNVGIRID
jgi:hypothetical protein